MNYFNTTVIFVTIFILKVVLRIKYVANRDGDKIKLFWKTLKIEQKK